MTNDELNNYSSEMLDRISNNVVKYRKERGLSQLQLALEIGLMGNAFIARAEKRTKNQHFNIEQLVKIAKVLDVEIGEFFK